jgi:hypothetical protein
MYFKTLPETMFTQKNKPILFFMALLFLSATSFGQMNGNYTVNAGAAPSATNFQSFNELASLLNAQGISGNVTVDVVDGSGPYVEQVTFNTINGTGPGAVVTINGNGNVITSPAAIIQNIPPSNPDRHIIRVTNVSYFTINNLRVNMVTGSTGFIGIHLYSNSAPVTNITINRVYVDMGTATSTLIGGIAATGSQSSLLTGGNFSNITFSNDTTTGGGYGAVMYGLTASPVLNSIISGNVFNGTTSNGIYVHTTNDLAIRDNAVNFNASNGIQLAGSANLRALVERNIVSATNPTTTGNLSGILVFGNTAGFNTNKVVNNLVWKMNAQLATVYGLEARSSGAEFYYNTVILDDATATGTRSIGLLESSANSGTILKNNIFYITRPSANYGAALALTSSSVVTTAVTSDNNVFYLAGGNNYLAVRQGITGTNPPTNIYTALSDWRTASNKDLNSFQTNPSFTLNTAIPTSAIINNQAVSVAGITTDIVGASRTGTPDPGAYEFASAPIDAAISRFVPPAAPFCGSSLSVQFELTNSGSNTLTSATIDWTVNGVPQTPINWTGSLVSGTSIVVILGNIPINSANTYQLIATVSGPNGQIDAYAPNNSVTYSGYRSGMAGAFTINGGSPASPSNYHNFQSLANDLSIYGVCGTVDISVLNGPYVEQVSFYSIPGASSDNSIRLNGNNQLLSFNASSLTDHVLELNNVHYLSIQALHLKSTHATNGRALFITNGASHIDISRCNIEVSKTSTSSDAFGILASGENYLLDGSFAKNLTISTNTIVGGYVGVQITGSDPGLVDFVNITDNTLQDQYLYGIQATGIKDADISRNDISRPTRTNSGNFYGISLSFRSNGFKIDKNRIHDLQNSSMVLGHLAGGISVSGTSIAPSTGAVSNNLIYNLTNTSTQYGINDASWGAGSNISIYHNTIALNYTAMTGTSAVTTSAIGLTATSTPTGSHDIKNNIVYISRGGSGASANKRLLDIGSASTSFTSDYNVFFFETGVGNLHYARVATTTYPSFATWQGTGKDVNSVNLNPQFVDTTNDNYHPSNAAVDGGNMHTLQVGGITTDILNLTRSASPDPGAYEFSGTLPVRLLYFKGQRKASANQLQWTTATEINNKGFEVQHSRNGVNFSSLGFVTSKATNGNSSGELDYLFDDVAPNEGYNYYRLMQIDNSGKFEYSAVIRILNSKGTIIGLGSLYPNPAKNEIKTTISSLVTEKITLVVTDLSGRILIQKPVQLTSGDNIIELPISALAAGTYLLKTICANGCENFIQKFIRQ